MQDDDLKLKDAVLVESDQDRAKLLLLFLLLFKQYTSRFECNDSVPEIDYVFFAYDTMYNHIDDIKDTLKSNTAIRRLSYASYFLTSIEKMERTL